MWGADNNRQIKLNEEPEEWIWKRTIGHKIDEGNGTQLEKKYARGMF